MAITVSALLFAHITVNCMGYQSVCLYHSNLIQSVAAVHAQACMTSAAEGVGQWQKDQGK